MRVLIKRFEFQHIISTRSIIAGELLKKRGLDFKKELLVTWTDDEKKIVKNNSDIEIPDQDKEEEDDED